jgi:L-ascorbate metabolism protein UlaG (beta-lactamase superfamily)
VRLTHVGGPTVLIEVAGWRILTDPTFDPPGRRYGFGWGTASTKTGGPSVGLAGVGPFDLVLLSHDHHADNLDDLGRQALASATKVLTTPSAARRLGDPCVGLRAWDSQRVEAPGKPALVVTATPCRHGPPLSRPVVGQVVGFAIRAEGWERSLWVSGDTVFYAGVRQISARVPVHTAVLHLGRVTFPITGPLRYSMSGRDAIRTIDLIRPEAAIPVHFEGWSHFSEQETALRDRLATAPTSVTSRLRWLERGEPTQLPDPD